ncbi:silencing defective 5 [Wolffia australiana]
MDEEAALKSLFEVFGSSFSLEDIASAFVSAGGDVNAAGEFLSQDQAVVRPIDEFPSGNYARISESDPIQQPNDEDVDKSSTLGKDLPGLKSQKPSASMGTVSSWIGTEYYSSKSSQTERPKPSKPLRIELKGPVLDHETLEMPSSLSSLETGPQGSEKTVDFLFSMLGDGFKLDRGAIGDVLGSCGYDVKKTMDHFLSKASPNLDKDDSSHDVQNDISNISAQRSQTSERNPLPSRADRKSARKGSLRSKKSALQTEILESLFCAPKIPEELPKRTRLPMGLNRTRTLGQRAVSGPLDDVELASPVQQPEVKDVDFKEDEYLIHRKAAKQNWEIMRAYYEAAMDAFLKGDRAKASYLQEQGLFYLNMAQEADKKSAELILCKGRREDEFLLDLHGHRPKEAVKLLKYHLQYLAGIQCYQVMKVIVEAGNRDLKTEKRRKMVVQFLEKESIQWTEDGGTIFIQISTIDLGKLSVDEETV